MPNVCWVHLLCALLHRTTLPIARPRLQVDADAEDRLDVTEVTPQRLACARWTLRRMCNLLTPPTHIPYDTKGSSRGKGPFNFRRTLLLSAGFPSELTRQAGNVACNKHSPCNKLRGLGNKVLV